MTTHDPGEIQGLAAQFDMFITRLRDDEYLLYDNDTNQLVLGGQSGRERPASAWNRSGCTWRDSGGEADGPTPQLAGGGRQG